MPGPVSSKNFMISPAGSDLGLGDQLTEQLTVAEIEMRKKRLADRAAAMGSGQQPSTPATADLFGGSLNGL